MKKILLLIVIVSFFSWAKKDEDDILYDKYDPLTAAISKVVRDAYEFNKKGLEALEKKKYDEAIDAFEEALKILPTYSDAENNLGVAFFKKGIVGEARRIWESLYKRDPEYAVGVYNLGLLYVYENRLEEALRLFERASKLQSRFVEAVVRCGITSIELGRKDKGFEYLQKAYKMSPSHPDAACFYAYALVLKGDTISAIEILRKQENNINAMKLLADIEKARKNYKKAAEYFSKVVKAGEDPSLLVELASSLNESGQCKEAIATLEKYFSYNISYSADAYLAMGIAQKDCGKIDEAIKFFEEGVNKYPRDPILSYNLGQLYFHKKKFEQAEEMWAMLSDSLQDPSVLYFRAIIARNRKD
ncbi:MAG: tetratricopeptide repeat protein, partial [Chitinispirillaceae bacterium]|nr:tetratricopeptide repeat protein [Chitinispirillaceae bacterium]